MVFLFPTKVTGSGTYLMEARPEEIPGPRRVVTALNLCSSGNNS